MKKKGACCDDVTALGNLFRVESVVGVDDRGQMVIPKEVREKLNILPGDKLAVVVMEREGKPCCLTLIKADDLADAVKGMLGPVAAQMGVR